MVRRRHSRRSPLLVGNTVCRVWNDDNGLPSMEILGQAPGKSTGEAMKLMEQLASKLPTGVGYDWTGMSYQERPPEPGRSSMVRDFVDCRVPVSGGAVRAAGRFRSPLCWSFRWGLSVRSLRQFSPWWRRLNDVYFQVGLLTTIGLSAKNAILIVDLPKT